MGSAPVLLRGGTVVDGTGGPARRADVLLSPSTILDVAPDLPSNGVRVIDCTGLLVCPGFIDTHSHSELRLLHGDPPRAKIAQGVTTEILGQDGLSVAPVSPGRKGVAADLVAGLLGSFDVDWEWTTIRGYLDALARRGIPVNAGMLVPHGMVRMAVKGMDDSPATADELGEMATLLSTCLEEGALGLSTGLVYPPCVYADTRELEVLSGVTARYGRPLVVHLRSEGRYVIEAVSEIIGVAQKTGVHVHVSHFMVTAGANQHLLEPLLELVHRARRDGVSLTCDQYPYLAGCTVLTALLPPWSMEGGVETLLARLSDPLAREKIRTQILSDSSPGWESRAMTIGLDKVVLSSASEPDNAGMEGMDVAAIAAARGLHPVDALLDLILEEKGRATMIMHHLPSRVVESIMTLPFTMCCTDGIYGGRPHPRLYGAFARRLSVYTRDRSLLDLPTAVHGMTGLPTATFGLVDRGTLTRAKVSDIVVLCLDSIEDLAGYEQPRRHPAGIRHVLVGGQPVVEDGQFTGLLPGRALGL